MHTKASSHHDRRAGLARTLTLRAVLGLMLMGWASLLLLCIAIFLVHEAWFAGHEPDTAYRLAASLAGLMLALLGVRAIVWLLVGDPLPEGVLLPREAARSLHRKVRRMGERFGGLRVDAVWVTGDMNAAVLQRPSLGLFGRMQTHLLLGLPLAHSVTPLQLSAILAHEFAHLAAQRQGRAAWGRHLRSWWFRVIDRLLADLPFLEPLVNLLTRRDVLLAAELSRIEEFEADELAARLVGADLIGEALVEVALKEQFLFGDFWDKVMAQSASSARPRILPYREMGLGMSAGFRRPAGGAALRALCETHEGGDGLHPSLGERLDALGAELKEQDDAAHEQSAAARHMAPALPMLASAFDREWWEMARTHWLQAHRSARRRRRRPEAPSGQ
ncbi:MAG: M48 family metallopeptidase [Rhodocyclaceae bacterium]